VDCGARLDNPSLPAEVELHLRRLIYFHFALAQLAVLGAISLVYCYHWKWKRYYLIVSYNEKGTGLNPPGIRMAQARVYRCHLGNLQTASLPPAGAPVLVYPMFMLSGTSSGRKLVEGLQQAYRHSARQPQLYFQPVLGASPWLAEAAAREIAPQTRSDVGVLVVAHDSTLPEPPPEPALFCRRLRELLPGTEIALSYFNQAPEAREVLRSMSAEHVLVLPFLLTEGVHTQRDLPTAADAAACGKTLKRLPALASLLDHQS
jgi:sirohydrochlorin ferrochelatase